MISGESSYTCNLFTLKKWTNVNWWENFKFTKSICSITQTCYFSRHKGTVYFDCFKNQHQRKLLQQPITKDELQ